jgi:hypothetical protein
MAEEQGINHGIAKEASTAWQTKTNVIQKKNTATQQKNLWRYSKPNHHTIAEEATKKPPKSHHSKAEEATA